MLYISIKHGNYYCTIALFPGLPMQLLHHGFEAIGRAGLGHAVFVMFVRWRILGATIHVHLIYMTACVPMYYLHHLTAYQIININFGCKSLFKLIFLFCNYFYRLNHSTCMMLAAKQCSCFLICINYMASVYMQLRWQSVNWVTAKQHFTFSSETSYSTFIASYLLSPYSPSKSIQGNRCPKK